MDRNRDLLNLLQNLLLHKMRLSLRSLRCYMGCWGNLKELQSKKSWEMIRSSLISEKRTTIKLVMLNPEFPHRSPTHSPLFLSHLLSHHLILVLLLLPCLQLVSFHEQKRFHFLPQCSGDFKGKGCDYSKGSSFWFHSLCWCNFFLGFGFDLQHLRGKDRAQSSMMTSIPQTFLLVIVPFCQ